MRAQQRRLTEGPQPEAAGSNDVQQSSRVPVTFARRRTRSWPCPSPARFSLLVAYHRSDIALHLSGELRAEDLDALDQCVSAALDDAPRQLILDLSSLTDSDDAGIAYIEEARRRAEPAAVQLVIASPDSCVLERLTRDGHSFVIRREG